MKFEQKADELSNKWFEVFRDLRDETMAFFEDLENSDLTPQHKLGIVMDMTDKLNNIRGLLV